MMCGNDQPPSWHVDFVKWLHKKGDTLDWLNYRGVVLVSQLSKLFERAVPERLLVWVEVEEPPFDLQATGSRGLNVRHQRWLVMESLRSRAVSGVGTHVLFVDFTRAFPTTLRAFALTRLCRLGHRGGIVSAMWRLACSSTSERPNAAPGLFTDAAVREIGFGEGRILSPLLSVTAYKKTYPVRTEPGWEHFVASGEDGIDID